MLAVFLAALVATPAQCAVPTLSLQGGDAAFSSAFAEGSANLAKTKDNFAAGYASACGKGHLKSAPLRALTLLNAPDANIASIFEADGQSVLEYPFVASDGSVNIPAAEEIEEAIYCAVVGATEAEQEESGRCLPD